MSLTLQNISIAYGSKKILSDITLDAIKPGTLVALLGKNGAGKSTLIKGLAGLKSYQGEASLDGVELANMTQHQRLKSIGYVPQTLPQGSSLLAYEVVKSVVTLQGESTFKEQTIEDVFERLKISHLALWPMHKLSGGQRQMISLAQAIVRKPKLYLLDEPTSALDLNWQMQVLKAIREEVSSQNAIAILISHDINLALRYSDQVVLLNQGQILAEGPPKESLTVDHLAQAYNVNARIESCSKGHPIILIDNAL
ncbi:ABC transporter ATP-binding protein [Marinomonas colpomeniae]|uniref:ABC transporter ATP-binding protein n=1 Tax=Marinomonas colpomeniae TaxID=2774408 RepID=A0ABR8P1I9_9GAMM|nr:ABC transporter ATP-binding protein [Marinomonas colpomeniae]MBD5771303.1 ABC transporter ATP-binding protein [Marinomonas colpomeniae]